MTETKINGIEWWGDSGEWIAAPGHLDLAEFTAAADARAKHDAGIPDDELPSVDYKAEHHWYRPLTREWFDKNYPRSPHMSTDSPQRVELAQQQRYEDYRDEGMQEPCEGDDAGAQPWTVIRTGA